MSATRDLSPEDIYFEPNGRLVIKNEKLAEEIRKKLQEQGKVDIFTSPTPPKPGPPPNMCGCTYKPDYQTPKVDLGKKPGTTA